MIRIEVNWELILIDEPVKRIFSKLKSNKVDLDSAVEGFNCIDEAAGAIAKQKTADVTEQADWKEKYLSTSVLDALVSQKGGYGRIIQVSEKSPLLGTTLDQIEREYGGSRITLKRITAPEYAEAAEKLLKARVRHRKKLVQTP